MAVICYNSSRKVIKELKKKTKKTGEQLEAEAPCSGGTSNLSAHKASEGTPWITSEQGQRSGNSASDLDSGEKSQAMTHLHTMPISLLMVNMKQNF